jgi:hypothetical protein
MDYLFRCFMRRRRSREVDEDLVTDLPRSDRAARNVLPRTSVPEDVAVDEGVIGFLYECDQFIDSSGIHDPIRGVRTHHSILKDVRICRYLGEHIGIREKNRRAVAGIGGKIAFAGSNESDEETDVFIDGNVGGNISSMINSHCTLHNAYLRKETEDFPSIGTAALVVYASRDIDSDDDVYIQGLHVFDDALPLHIPVYHCLCKGRDVNGEAICEVTMT